MNYISPTRVSVYDFLYEDTLPLTVLLADVAQLSYPQARLAMTSGLQAITSALLSYQSRHGGDAVLKRLFNHSGIKALRQYNSMNFVTLETAVYHRQTVTDTLFPNSKSISTASDYIATLIDADTHQVHKLLCSLSVICLRELAILADYAHLDAEDINNWLKLQPQFLSSARFATSLVDPDTQANNSNDANLNDYHNSTGVNNCPPAFDPHWYEVTKFAPPASQVMTASDDGVPHYAKVIGRSVANASQSLHDDSLAFAGMDAVALPNQRWLLQLAKISDVYLSRHRLKIASEPKTPPSRPLVNLGLLGNANTTPATASESPIVYDSPAPLWRNPVIWLIIIVIGSLGGLAFLKYQSQQAERAQKAAELIKKSEEKRRNDGPQDVAIVRVDDADAATSDPASP